MTLPDPGSVDHPPTQRALDEIRKVFPLTADKLADSAASAGTYTPTLTNDTNLDASTAYQCQYIRVGNVVSVSGKVDVDPTAAGALILFISLPVASDLGALEDCGGAASAVVSTECYGIAANTVSNKAQMQGLAVTTTNHGVWFTFQYEVI